MKIKGKKLINILHAISFCLLLILGAVGVIYELIGHKQFEELLTSIGIQNGIYWYWLVGLVVLAVLLITYVLKHVKKEYQHIQWIGKNPVYVSFKRHFCPVCNVRLDKIKKSRIVNSHSPEANEFDFSSGDTYMIGNVKFIWTEFQCPECKRCITVDEMKQIEKTQKSGGHLP